MSSFKFIVSTFGLQNVKQIRYDGEGTQLTLAGEAFPYGFPESPRQNQGNIFAYGEDAKSYLGTQVVSRMKLQDPNDKTLFLEIDVTISTVNKSKNVVKTAINGREGTVKEYISGGDYMIDCKGALVNTEHTYRPPTDQIQKLIRLFELRTHLSISSPFINQFGIGAIVIESFEMPQSEGFINMQAFSFSASSDLVGIQLLIPIDQQAESGEDSSPLI